ncbi:MAG: tRNA (cytidine(34)-2'-O)-methyltransferase [Elusimicrobia bacterium]|nr:tRNA (cytidine(34)-2'-O)-methyltransferase [Elusimicrobiota bacterium]
MNIVLVEPEIHWNAGNVGRTCVGTGTALHLVEPLGFKVTDKEIRRSGLDYWPKLNLKIHKSLPDFLQQLPQDASLVFFSTKGKRPFDQAPYRKDSYLVFGGESKGLPAFIHKKYSGNLFRIPILPAIRSLNLSSSVAAALYQALFQTSELENLN